MRLRSKLLLPMFITVMCGIVIVVYYLHNNAEKAITLEIEKNIQSTVTLSVKFINEWLEAGIADIKTWSTQQVFRDALTESGYYGQSASVGAAQMMESLVRGYPYYDCIFIADTTGDVVAASSSHFRKNKAIQVGGRAYFKEAVQGRTTTISKILKSRYTDSAVFAICTPVFKDDKVVGVLAATIAVKKTQPFLIGNKVSQTENATLLCEADGSVFARMPDTISIRDMKTLPNGDSLLKLSQGIFTFGLDKQKKMAGFKRIPETGWFLVEIYSLDKALAPIKKIRHYSAVAAVIILLVILLAVNLIFKHILHTPLEHALETIEAVNKGDFKSRIPATGRTDEIGILITAFNQMIEQLDQTLQELGQEIEERKAAEKKLAEHRDNLENIVNIRTEALEREHEERKQLENRLHMAEKMKAIGTLAGGVAHDLNNILSGIVSYPDLILMDLPDDSPLRPKISMIQDSGIKAAAIVQDLLTLARRGVKVTEACNVNTLITEYMASSTYKEMKASNTRITVETDFEKPLWHIDGSPVHLFNTIMNLVSNGAESMPDGGVITIRTRNCFIDYPLKGYENTTHGKYVRLSVTDTGSGIAQEDINRIYEPFYTKKKMGRSGTGLGMAVVWGTITDHDGYIVCESALGEGTTFHLYFHAYTPNNSSREQDDAFPEGISARGEETVLIIDDVEEQRLIASEIVSKMGYKASTAASGEEALEFLSSHKTDIIVLDMIMRPGIDGYETYRRVLELRPGQKAVIATGYSEMKIIESTQKLGAGKCITKPYSVKALCGALREELDK